MPDNETAALERSGPLVAAPGQRRPAPRRIKVLLPVWGYDYTRQFLRVSLPTLLAPGNLPALAGTLPTEFVFLTSRKDQQLIGSMPAYRRLAQVCPVEFLTIDDIITDGNHSTTVTLAYARAVRLTGAEMVDTCFFFLVSDYIFADGSLGAVVRRMMAGASAVQTGNFQVVEDNVSAWLDRDLERVTEALAIPPRELMRRALVCMHPSTVANTINVAVSHNTGSNRLFWRVDGSTLIGRFYLMHMICVRPEVADFVIGASCDYSFVPEMCPSGAVEIITDSDEFLVVEAQPRGHEANFLSLGPFTPAGLAASLSEWTTAGHRDNVRHTVVFHSADLPPRLGGAVAEADRFVAEVTRLLRPQPQPHRDHPYWRGAIAAHHAQTGQRPNDDDWLLMLGQPLNRSTRAVRRFREALLGRAPHLKRWHPRWRDYRRPIEELTRHLATGSALLVVSRGPTPMTNWLADSGSSQRIPLSRLLRPDFDPAEDNNSGGRFDVCFIELAADEFARAHVIVDRVLSMLKPGGEILVASFNRDWTSNAQRLANEFGRSGQDLFQRLDVSLEEMVLVGASGWRWSANYALLRLLSGWHRQSPLHRPVAAARLLVQGMLALGANVLARPGGEAGLTYRSGQVLSSIFMRLHASPAADDGGRDGKPETPPVETPGARSPALGAATMEPQYERLLAVEQEVGLTTLGLMTNQVWHEDPRRLTFILARYKFVAKMLGGYADVAELGCGDAFGSRIVQQEVSGITVYDFDPLFIRDVTRRQSKRWPLEAHVHDILLGPLPRRHNAIYSLDVIEHIPAAQEDQYLGNLTASLNEHGVLIIGTPSLESQSYASPQSKIGHVNCKSGTELKMFLERYFHVVFLFSMNDEVVHTGFYPMAHYLFALCADKR